MSLVLVCIPAAILFVILLIFLSFQPKFIARITGAILCFAAVAGILIYGYGYYSIYKNVPHAIIRTLFSVFCMFLGRNEIGAISAAPRLATPAAQFFIYLVHILAIYFTASALITTLGAGLMRRLNLLLLRRRQLNLIYGVSEDTLAFAAELQSGKNRAVVFADSGCDAGFENRIMRLGGVLLADKAGEPSQELLRRIGFKSGRRHIDIYCLSRSPAENFRYASACKEIFAEAGILPEQTSLTILLEDEMLGEKLLASDDVAEGFGSVRAVEKYDLLSRLLFRACPPYSAMSFNGSGRAAEDFEALIVGFGRRGQAVLRRLVMNAQFAGSRFHVTVFAKDHRQEVGGFFYRYPGLRENYAIDFVDANARGIDAYKWLRENASRLNYVVICTGNDKENTEIGSEYLKVLADCGSRAPILMCSSDKVIRLTQEGPVEAADLFSKELISGRELDRMAMLLNHQYHLQEGNTAEEDWRRCDYFSRMSCCASADCLDAFLAAAGTDRDTARQSGWRPEGEILENLAEMEHLRWCAFHYAMGYQTMPEETVEARKALYRAQVEAEGNSKLRITKDAEARQHACLIPWDALDKLSAREAEATGKAPDYKQMDRDNVLMISEMLQKQEDRE